MPHSAQTLSTIITKSKGPLRLEEDCVANAHFARSIRALVVLEVLDKEWNHLEKLPSHLLYLKYVHLRGKIAKDSYFLFALGRHQNVRTIVVPSFRHLPDTSWTLAEHYLSKVLLRRFDLAKPKDIAQSVSQSVSHNQRIQVATISVRKVLHLLQEDSLSFSSKKFMGVRELSIDMGCSSDGFPWLPHFVSAHCPGLRKIVFLDLGLGAHVRQTDTPTIPFAIPFWESVSQAQQEGLDRRAYTLKSMSVSSRFNQVTWSEESEYPDQWDVCEVDLVINSSLDQILAIVASSFQTLIVFDLHLRGEIKYNIDDFIASLRSLPLLQHLGLFDSYSHLVCQDEKTCTGHHSTRDVDWVVDGSRPEDAVGMNVVCSGIVQYTSRIAREISSIKTFFLKEQSELVAELDRGVGPRRSQWTARVWLERTNLGHINGLCGNSELYLLLDIHVVRVNIWSTSAQHNSPFYFQYLPDVSLPSDLPNASSIYAVLFERSVPDSWHWAICVATSNSNTQNSELEGFKFHAKEYLPDVFRFEEPVPIEKLAGRGEAGTVSVVVKIGAYDPSTLFSSEQITQLTSLLKSSIPTDTIPPSDVGIEHRPGIGATSATMASGEQVSTRACTDMPSATEGSDSEDPIPVSALEDECKTFARGTEFEQ
ncbi:hypothetical protein C8R42DRAFT_646712 [Lentinula raphanica]|nr:hypothetical protein C8R42DRAFT_646712 [Lentinula raphanica]